MLTTDDLTIESIPEFFMFIPILIFCGLVAPFLIAAYSLGFFQKVIGWAD